MNLANSIKSVAKKHGTTITQLANELGVLQPQISRTINNPRISLEDLSKIADVIGCKVGDFFMYEVENGTTAQASSFVCPHCGKEIKVTLNI